MDNHRDPDKNLVELRDVAAQYGMHEIDSIHQLEGGLVNVSYKIETPTGDFVFQRLAPIWNESVINDYCAVGSFLRTKGLFVPFLLHTLRGNPYAVKNNLLWRAFEHVPNDNILESSPETAFEAAKTLGKFHRIMAKSRFQPTFQLPGFHDTPSIIHKLRNISIKKEYQEKAEAARKEIEFLLEETPKFYHILNGERTIIHGDPKMANFLFKNGKVVATLDLDTMMLASPLIDIGDGLRSWCRKKPSTSEFKEDVFQSAIAGYNAGNLEYQVSEEKAKRASALITLELATRYIIDSMEESYFALSPKYPSRHIQGLSRGNRCIDYYKNFIEI